MVLSAAASTSLLCTNNISRILIWGIGKSDHLIVKYAHIQNKICTPYFFILPQNIFFLFPLSSIATFFPFTNNSLLTLPFPLSFTFFPFLIFQQNILYSYPVNNSTISFFISPFISHYSILESAPPSETHLFMLSNIFTVHIITIFFSLHKIRHAFALNGII